MMVIGTNKAAIKDRPSITETETTILEASGMTMTIPKTSGRITKIGMRMRTKRGMSGRMDNKSWIVFF